MSITVCITVKFLTSTLHIASTHYVVFSYLGLGLLHIPHIPRIPHIPSTYSIGTDVMENLGEAKRRDEEKDSDGDSFFGWMKLKSKNWMF